MAYHRPEPSRGRTLGRIIDLHVHSTVGSFDSTTTATDIASLPRRIPALDGVVFTEHVHAWPDAALARLPEDILVFNEREFDTYRGHILTLGAPPGFRTSDVHELRARVLDSGGLMILAHPFRFYPSALSLLYPRAWHEPGEWPPERLVEHPLFGLVDAVEAWNHRVLPSQNELAAACARIRGLPVVGGSDSHMAEDLGRYATEFDDDVRTRDELIAGIRAGRCRPVALTEDGRYRPLGRETAPGGPGLAATAHPSENARHRR